MRRLVGTGLLAAVAAMVATALGATLARAVGVDLEVPDDSGSTAIPVSGVAFVTGVGSLVGLALAAGLHRWSARPAELFVKVTVALTVLSLVPPLLVGADAATAVTLIVLHLVAALVVVPALARALGLAFVGAHRPPHPHLGQ